MEVSTSDAQSQTSFQVLLPSHSHSLTVSLPTQATIADLKYEIFDKCAGKPRPNGQRVIWKGRVLADGEIVGEVMEPSNGPHTIHLAVHPSAWTSAPPDTTSALTSNNPTILPIPTPTIPSNTEPVATSTSTPPGFNFPQLQLPHLYLHYLHTNALRLLAGQYPLPWPGPTDIQSSRSLAKDAVTKAGFGWAAELDDDLPSPQPGLGAKYDITFVGNLPYLQLADPTSPPSPTQRKALQILSYTFPLLPLAPALSSFIVTLPQAQAQAPAPPAATDPQQPPRRRVLFEVNIPAHAILPIFLHILRAGLFVYFFTPVQQPIWLAAVAAWVCWEAYGILRQGNDEIRREGQAAPNGNQNGAPNAGVAPQNGPAGAAQQPARNTMANLNARATAQRLVDRIALLGFEHDEQVLDLDNPTDPQRTPRPASIFQRFFAFVLLFVATLFPPVWDRRRALLRQREARVKEIYGAGRPRRNQPETVPTSENGEQPQEQTGPAEGERRRVELHPWVRQYVQDVLNGDIAEEGEL